MATDFEKLLEIEKKNTPNGINVCFFFPDDLKIRSITIPNSHPPKVGELVYFRYCGILGTKTETQFRNNDKWIVISSYYSVMCFDRDDPKNALTPDQMHAEVVLRPMV